MQGTNLSPMDLDREGGPHDHVHIEETGRHAHVHRHDDGTEHSHMHVHEGDLDETWRLLERDQG